MEYKFKPFSDNIVFFDTEFSSNDLAVGEILSIALVKVTGEELYLELENSGEISDWVKENIIPTLKNEKVSKENAAREILKFIGEGKPYLLSYRIPYDTVYLHKLFGKEVLNDKDFPFSLWPMDFASFLFSIGYDPRSFVKENLPDLAGELGVDIEKYQLHNALDDAKLLREVYLKMTR